MASVVLPGLLGILTFLELISEIRAAVCHSKSEKRDDVDVKHCSVGCCGDEGSQYCCVVSKAVIIGCSVGGLFVVIIVIGVICYCLIPSKRHKRQLTNEDGPRKEVRSFSEAMLDISDEELLQYVVRRPSRLSEASLPSTMFPIPSKFRPKKKNPATQNLVLSAIPEDSDKDGPSSP